MTGRDAEFLSGTPDMLILKALPPGALHGFGVGRRIKSLPACGGEV